MYIEEIREDPLSIPSLHVLLAWVPPGGTPSSKVGLNLKPYQPTFLFHALFSYR